MGKELEIKLVGAPGDIAALRRSRVLAGLAAGESEQARLVSTYYDTADGALARAGLSLRLREEGGRRLQTLKRRRAEGGTFDREEDERALGPGEAFPVIPEEDPSMKALLDANGALGPVARTVTDRWTLRLEKGRTRIEAGVDLGRLEAPGEGGLAHAAPLAEAELELLEGRARTLFDVARRLLDEADGRLRLGLASKEDQARELGRGALAPGPDNEIDLNGEGSVGDAYAAALKATARRVIDLAPSIIDLRQPEGVHQMRVALRRFRAVERMFRNAIDDPELRSLARRSRRFARALSPARDWDVFLGETLPPLKAHAPQEGFDRLVERAETLRANAWDKAARTVASARFAKFALDLLEAAYLQSWRKHAGSAADEAVSAFAARSLDSWLDGARRVAASVDPGALAARHPLRIALKKLRYAAQTFRSLYPLEARKTYMAAMSRLQDGLGAINDAVVAETLANEAAKGQGKTAIRAAGFVIGFSAARAVAAAENNDEAFRAFDAMTPFWRMGDDLS